MTQSLQILSCSASQRRGAISILAAFVIMAMLSITGFLLSLSYIELTRTELQAATDASARSAVIALVTTQSEDAGRVAAQDIAARYRVGSQPFALSGNDIEFGKSSKTAGGSFEFDANQTPLNAARVIGKKTDGSAAGPASLPFGRILGHELFETQRPAAAMRLDYDICLVLDRSGSMAWDLSQERFDYPSERSERPLLENYFSAPHPTDSRWAILSESVAGFLDILDTRDVSARIGLVTFASDYEFGWFASEKVTRNSDLSESFGDLAAAVTAVGQKPVIGATNVSAGLLEAKAMLLTSNYARRQTAHPTIVLFSDGIYTEGGDPVPVAEEMYQQYGVVIHCVTFGAEPAARQTMDDISSVAGKGLSLHANSAAELQESFRTIANAIPVLVTQ